MEGLSSGGVWGSVGFGLFDVLLESFLEDFANECSSFDEEKGFEVIEGL